MKEALILFVRQPELGKVKTRLAKDIGEEKALGVYKQLLQHTHDITYALSCDKFVYYAESIASCDIWEDNSYFKKIQSGRDLGERMQNAFSSLFDTGYKKVVIIGSDCPGITSEIISEAFDALDSTKAVLGPAADGGYYLLGMHKMINDVFINKLWSTDSVFADTVSDLKRKEISYHCLSVLQDVDTITDLDQLRKIQQKPFN